MHMRTMRNTNNLGFNNHAKFVNNCRRPSCEGRELKQDDGLVVYTLPRRPSCEGRELKYPSMVDKRRR